MIFNCKVCGGELNISSEMSIAECKYCRTTQTVPKAIDENLQNLFNRANSLRIRGDFDKAEKLYEKIIENDDTQSEAYWGLVLCKYGIEYVDDPATGRKLPTCHRASYDSVISDGDYKTALEYADADQRVIYEEQVSEIDRIQREILALAQAEEAYDVFICYKETDENGKRTHDSVIANDIYYQLTAEGFKVFYAAITLEGKLGSAYEPIIFAALNSAKVMLVIGTKPEYFNAVWVKNEWSRYLKIIKKDRQKLLIPCYRDMDAYDLPEEFAHLQAQDMTKIGFVNDIIRGIKKVIKKDDTKKAFETKESARKESDASGDNPTLDRGFICIEDGDFKGADECFERVLDSDPRCAMAYLGKLMIDLKVKNRRHIATASASFEDNVNYKRIIRFGDEALIDEINEYLEEVKTSVANKPRANETDVFAKFKQMAAQATSFVQTHTQPQSQSQKNTASESQAKTQSDAQAVTSSEPQSQLPYKIPVKSSLPVPTEAEVMKQVKERDDIKKLKIIGIIALIFYWPVGVGLLIWRNFKINKEVKAELEKYRLEQR